jgi:hypothetical protein
LNIQVFYLNIVAFGYKAFDKASINLECVMGLP